MKGEREGGKHQCVVASRVPPNGDLARSPGMCLSGNHTGDPLVCRLVLKPLSHTSQGCFLNFSIKISLKTESVAASWKVWPEQAPATR